MRLGSVGRSYGTCCSALTISTAHYSSRVFEPRVLDECDTYHIRDRLAVLGSFRECVLSDIGADPDRPDLRRGSIALAGV